MRTPRAVPYAGLMIAQARVRMFDPIGTTTLSGCSCWTFLARRSESSCPT